jgi:GT2 family glycosyltransferase
MVEGKTKSLPVNLTPADSEVVSIVINCRNRQDSLDRLIDSIERQAFDAYEVVILDDASAPPLITKGGKARLIRSDKQLGVGAGRNLLAREAKGAFLLFLDDDTEIVSVDLLRHLKKMSQRQGHRSVFAGAQLTPERRLAPQQAASTLAPSYCRRFLGYCFFSPRKLWLEVGGFYEPFGYQFEEPEVCWRVLDAGYSVVFDPDFQVIHHVVAGRPEQMQAKHENITGNMLAAAVLRAPVILLPAFMASVPLRYWRFSEAPIFTKLAGLWRGLRRFIRLLPFALRDRRPVSFGTWMKYRSLKSTPLLSENGK